MRVTVIGGEIPVEEQQAYINRAIEKYGEHVVGLTIKIDENNPEWVDLDYELDSKKPFTRLRRITGYLVGHLERWNNAKSAEEKDREKHGV